MNDTTLPLRVPAEWEYCDFILMAEPNVFSDWNYILPQAKKQYLRLIKTFIEADENVMLMCRNREEASVTYGDCNSRLSFVEMNYNDTWTRDYGPITAIKYGKEIRQLDFGFNGWGLKFASNLDNLVNLGLQKRGVISPNHYRNNRDFELEGGSVDSDGKGTILTTSRCLLSPNRNGGRSKAELNEILKRRLGADHVLWLDHGFLPGDDTDSHVDTLARLAPHDTIIYCGCDDEGAVNYSEMKLMEKQLKEFRTAEGSPFNLVELPMPDAIYDPDDGIQLPATYANYLVTPRNIFIPSYGQPQKDEPARKIINSVFPNHTAYSADCLTLLRQHGSLHCSTMQMTMRRHWNEPYTGDFMPTVEYYRN